MSERKVLPRWPLFLIAAPAAVAVWSGWVGLGQLAGFGLVQPLPGILPWHLDTAITLPVGVEAYGAYALGAWLSPGAVADRARTFARRSAIGSLGLGMLGQVAFHLLAAAHATRAPWPVTVMVACMPVCTLGLGVALTHLLRASGHSPDMSADQSVALPVSVPPTDLQTGLETGSEQVGQTGSEVVGGPVRKALPAAKSGRSGKRQANRPGGRATSTDAEREFAAEIAAGQVPSLYQIRNRLRVGNDRAKVLRQHIARQALST